MALQAAADELYGLPPEQFTAARDDFAARLRRAGERELAAAVRDLRRPSVSAWLVNLLVRRKGTDLDDLLDIGDRLRLAMTTGAGADVRALTEDRRAAIGRLVADVKAIAGRPVTVGASEEVQLTLEAATADPAAATAVRSGRLVRPLRYAGFGEVADLADAVGLAAPLGPEPPPTQRRGKPTKTAAGVDTARRAAAEAVRLAEEAALEAAGRADDAQRHYEHRVAEQAVAAEAVERAEAAAAALRRQVAEGNEQVRVSRDAERAAAAEAEAARRTARQAHQAAETARRRLARARSPAG